MKANKIETRQTFLESSKPENSENIVKPVIENVGLEFIEWAEKYWCLDKLLLRNSDHNAESCPYEYMRKVFIKKINELSDNKNNI